MPSSENKAQEKEKGEQKSKGVDGPLEAHSHKALQHGLPLEKGERDTVRSASEDKSTVCSDTPTKEECHAGCELPAHRTSQAGPEDRVGGLQVLQKGCVFGAWASPLLLMPKWRGKMLDTSERSDLQAQELEPREYEQACNQKGKMGLEKLGLVGAKESGNPPLSTALNEGIRDKAEKDDEGGTPSNHFVVVYDEEAAEKPNPPRGKNAKKLAKVKKEKPNKSVANRQ